MARGKKNVIELQPQRRQARQERNPFDLAMGLEARHINEAILAAEVRRSFELLANSPSAHGPAWKPKKAA